MKVLSISYLRKLLIGCIITCLGAGILIAQGSGTPSTLRVLVDASNNLLVSSSALSGAATSCVFSNCRLRTDASGNLVITDGSGAGFAPANATYITQTPSSGLSAEQALSALSTGLLWSTTTTGVVSSIANVAAGQVLTSGSPAAWSASPTLTSIVLTQGSISADAQVLSATSTWNNAGVTFTGIKYIITDTASAAGSLALSIKGGASGTTDLFSLTKAGRLTIAEDLRPLNVYSQAAGYLGWVSRSIMASPSDGVITLTNNATTDFTRLQFGGTTSSFPSLKRNSTILEARLADDSGYASMNVSGLTASGAIQLLTSGQSFLLGATKLIINTAPTISSGFGSSPSIASNNGTAAFTINVGTGGVATSGVIGLPTATTGWSVSCSDVTTKSATVFYTKQTATSTTSATVGNYDAAGAAAAWVASDILVCQAMAY